ncbi:MAG: response regulator [Proteobacteria bacterium]|jgi:DNA-binding NtrC family response regulator|nr:response regulator [Pseudomonadota bacterium]
MARLLLVDDEPNVLNALRRVLQRAFHGEDLQIEICDDPLKALTRVESGVFDLVVSDYRMPTMDGVTFLKHVRRLQPDAVRLILSASTDFDALMTAVNEAEIFRYLIKPWSDEALVDTLREGLVRHQQVREDRRLADEQRLQQGELSAEEIERRRIEAEEPGITRVKWGPDGSVLLDDL